MGFVKPTLPDVDLEDLLRRPLMERIRIMSTHWADHGLGVPRMIHVLYIAKLVFFYALGGVVIATATSHLPAFWDVSGWWNQPIVYQKLILWTILLELLGLAGSWGPLAGKTKPMTGGYRFWAKLNTIRLRPWKAVPFTNGDRRTWFDIIVYLALIAGVIVALVAPGVHSDSLSAVLPHNTSGLVNPALLVVPIVLLVVIGLRDKTIFLAARGEQYLPALLFFATLPFVDMIIACKLLIGTVWIWAGISKFGVHFTSVIPPMMSNSPAIPFKRFKRAHYRNFPHDLRPSHLATFMAHGPGSFVEIVAPLALLLSPWPWLTFGAAAIMLCFHLFIISTFPLAVPVEWNVLFGYITVFLFLGFPAWDGYAISDMSSPWLTVALLIGMCFFPVLGNLRPDLVSFLPAMRQYAGNWASAVWTFTPGAEQKLNRVTRSAPNTVDQYINFGWDPVDSEVFTQQVTAWRSLHSQGRGLYSVLLKNLPDIDTRTVREAEMSCNTIIGFNFGEGHLHNEDLIRAIQTEAQFEPGEFVIVWVESQPIHKKTQEYKVIDASIGVIERGTWNVADLVEEQPWLPNGPIPLNVTWRRAGVHQ
ncbi:hypothetical protein M2272_001941 [Mycobacterium frederiksbergense]|uniref:DUF3556 domain-containing protein n=1 Tax=Mycolicibacterium frederiksbergense TaxID=117567 RepID=A0ABT6KYE3_9MYCO|nr:DUF3556 domain-containing protein [Mycolicibacterium frederiksbergense]MDH6195301.1 hypothetical protein [Mycolicibacterium frederiksbergense]